MGQQSVDNATVRGNHAGITVVTDINDMVDRAEYPVLECVHVDKVWKFAGEDRSVYIRPRCGGFVNGNIIVLAVVVLRKAVEYLNIYTTVRSNGSDCLLGPSLRTREDAMDGVRAQCGLQSRCLLVSFHGQGRISVPTVDDEVFGQGMSDE